MFTSGPSSLWKRWIRDRSVLAVQLELGAVGLPEDHGVGPGIDGLDGEAAADRVAHLVDPVVDGGQAAGFVSEDAGELEVREGVDRRGGGRFRGGLRRGGLDRRRGRGAAAPRTPRGAVGRRGSWVTSADEKGMFLFVGPGIPVMTADGKPVFVPYPPRARPSDAGAFIGGVRR